MSSPSVKENDEPEPPDPGGGQHRNTWKLVAAFVGLVVLLLALGSLLVGPRGGLLFGSSPVADAEAGCAEKLNSAAVTREFHENDRSLTLRAAPLDQPSVEAVSCVLHSLEIPGPMVDEIVTAGGPATRTGEFDGISVAWEVLDAPADEHGLAVTLNS